MTSAIERATTTWTRRCVRNRDVYGLRTRGPVMDCDSFATAQLAKNHVFSSMVDGHEVRRDPRFAPTGL